MRNLSPIILVFFFFLNFCSAQEEKEENPKIYADSTLTNPKEEQITIQDSVLLKREIINPLAPSKAAFLSSLLPGLGQVYNKKYWKVPIVYAVFGGSVLVYNDNHKNYKRFRTAFKRRKAGFTDDEFYDLRGDNAPGSGPDLDIDVLENQQERYQQDRDLWLSLCIISYVLNIVDANVDAHLKQFNIDSNLSLNFEPYFEMNTVVNNPNYGMALTLKF